MTHSSILAWRIPWTEEPGGLQSMGLQRVRHDWGLSLSGPCALSSNIKKLNYNFILPATWWWKSYDFRGEPCLQPEVSSSFKGPVFFVLKANSPGPNSRAAWQPSSLPCHPESPWPAFPCLPPWCLALPHCPVPFGSPPEPLLQQFMIRFFHCFV